MLAVGRRPQSHRRVSTFGQNLLRLRKRAGLSQDELAAKAGVGRATVARLEVGTVAGPGQKTADALAGALGVKTAELHETQIVLPEIDLAIASFARSHYAGILKPPLNSGDLARLRELAGSLWVNTRPTDEVLYYLVLAHRAGT